MTRPLDVRVEAPSFRALFGKTSQVEPKLKRALRRNIRRAGNAVADQMRSEVGTGAPGGLRAGIRAGIRVDVMTGSAREGVRLRATGPLSAAWESRRGWKHPVFGHAVWRRQHGRPYFFPTVASEIGTVRIAVEDAMREAVESLKGAS